MAGSMKDAFGKVGITNADAPDAAPKQNPKKWANELPDEETRAPHIPFDAPALTKAKPSSSNPTKKR